MSVYAFDPSAENVAAARSALTRKQRKRVRFAVDSADYHDNVVLMNAFLSFFMSEHGVAAMTFPITLEIATVLGLRPRQSNYGKALFIAMAWGTQIGGIATLPRILRTETAGIAALAALQALQGDM